VDAFSIAQHAPTTIIWFLIGTTRSASTTGGPKLPGVASPFIDVNGTSQVLFGVARSIATIAGIPVEGINLPNSYIPKVRSTAAFVVVYRIGIATGFVRDNAFAIFLFSKMKETTNLTQYL
jgi:hypothetical protein